MKLKGRYIPDDKIEVAPYIVDIPRGDGMTELMVLEAEAEKPKEIEYFHWDFPEAPKKSKAWVWVTVIAASIMGSIATFMMFFLPSIATPMILICLGWLGVVAFANK